MYLSIVFRKHFYNGNKKFQYYWLMKPTQIHRHLSPLQSLWVHLVSLVIPSLTKSFLLCLHVLRHQHKIHQNISSVLKKNNCVNDCYKSVLSNLLGLFLDNYTSKNTYHLLAPALNRFRPKDEKVYTLNIECLNNTQPAMLFHKKWA